MFSGFGALPTRRKRIRTFLVDVAGDGDAEAHLRVTLEFHLDGVALPFDPVLAAERRQSLEEAYRDDVLGYESGFYVLWFFYFDSEKTHFRFRLQSAILSIPLVKWHFPQLIVRITLKLYL